MRHYTPLDVARELAKYAPERCTSILEPAVGTGLLLDPLLDRLRGTAQRVMCADVDPNAMDQVTLRLRPILGEALELVHGDFLEYSSPEHGMLPAETFDCILMNPPFRGRKSDWIRLDLNSEFPGRALRARSAPVEAAFVVRALRLLKENGRLLAIIPSTLVASANTAWLRSLMLEFGSVLYVHELPKYTFAGVEARVYLLVFEKGRSQEEVVLRNHDLLDTESLSVRLEVLHPDFRLDFGFHAAREQHSSIARASSDLDWMPVEQVATVMRGSEGSPDGISKAIHTCDFRAGRWDARERLISAAPSSSVTVRAGDLLLKRVGRFCAQTIGLVAPGQEHFPCTDCVLMIRPRRAADAQRLLWALRVVVGMGNATRLLEQGTGATYITEGAVKRLLVPMQLPQLFPQFWRAYRKACQDGCSESMVRIEDSVRRTLNAPFILHPASNC